MPPPPESLRRRLAGRAIVLALIVLAAMPAYLTISPAWRPVAVRLVCALVAAAGCIRAVRWLRATAGPAANSPLDAPPPPPAEVELDPRFISLREDLVSAARSRRYFDVILWPRLCDLAGRDLTWVPPRRGLLRRRGPSLAAIEGLIAEVEEHP